MYTPNTINKITTGLLLKIEIFSEIGHLQYCIKNSRFSRSTQRTCYTTLGTQINILPLSYLCIPAIESEKENSIIKVNNLDKQMKAVQYGTCWKKRNYGSDHEAWNHATKSTTIIQKQYSNTFNN